MLELKFVEFYVFWLNEMFVKIGFGLSNLKVK